jgi:type 1 fimbria pilin
MKRVLLSFLLLLALPSAGWASCYFYGGATSTYEHDAHMALPTSFSVDRDAPVGTPLWDSGWTPVKTARILCQPLDRMRPGYGPGIGDLVTAIGGGVRKTNVDGIGIGIYWCPNQSCGLSPLSEWTGSVGSVWISVHNQWRVRLVKIAPEIGNGTLNFGAYSSIAYGNVIMSRLWLTGSTVVGNRGCELNPATKTISVPLPDVRASEFDPGLGVLRDSSKARSFVIQMQCDKGAKVYYQIDGTEASSGSNVLANAAGAGMATGVGVQLFQTNLANGPVQPLGSRMLFTTATSDDETVDIVLAARYYKTASRITGGRVDTTATFTLTYE